MAGFHAWLDELVSAMEPRPHHSGRGEVSSAGLPRHASAREPGSRSTAPARTPHTAHCTPHTATATAHRTPHAALRHRTPPPHTAHRTPPPHTARRHRTPRAQLASQAGRLAPAPRPARRSSLEPAGRPRLGEAAAPRRCGGARRGSRRGVLRRGDPSGRSERLQVRSALLAAVGAASRHPTAVEELEPPRTASALLLRGRGDVLSLSQDDPSAFPTPGEWSILCLFAFLCVPCHLLRYCIVWSACGNASDVSNCGPACAVLPSLEA